MSVHKARVETWRGVLAWKILEAAHFLYTLELGKKHAAITRFGFP